MFCNRCRLMMVRVFRFENGKSYTLYRCPKCYEETKQRPYSFIDYEISKKNTKTNKLRKPVKKPANRPVKKTNKKKRGK